MERNIFYYTASKDDLRIEQIKRLLSFEKVAKDVKLETDYPGLKVDFNSGARVRLPAGAWHVRISDYNSGIVAFDDDIADCTLVAAEKYYICWHVEVWKDGELVFEHVFDLSGQEVFIFMAGGALGDSISLFPYLRLMQQIYHCKISLLPPSEDFKTILSTYFPDINLVDEVPEATYASYCLAVFQFPPYLIPADSRMMTPGMAAQSILGLPRKADWVIYTPTAERCIKEKYVCIAVQASGIMKRWLYPDGWERVVSYLKELGYRVLCIDGAAKVIADGHFIEMPSGAEDFTGMKPLMERVNLLAYADFFIGLGSGLSWLAHACGIPVILISGFSLPLGEFYTPYRVTNPLACHGCYNDVRVDWKCGCPYHHGSDREFECSKSISDHMVRTAIDRVIADVYGSEM